MTRPIRLYWSSGLKRGRKNFGDWLGPALVRQLSGREVVHSSPAWADLITVGSVLQKLGNQWWRRRVHVWGSGFLQAPVQRLGRHHFHAVRGRLTAANLAAAPPDLAYGDPGLLAPLLLPGHADTPRTYRVGLVPHYKDQEDAAVSDLAARLSSCAVIDVLDEPLNVLRQIAGCRTIVSSSLHGLVVADAFGLPSMWLKCGDRVRGEDFKFRDYYSALEIDAPAFRTPASIGDPDIDALAERAPLNGVGELQRRLAESFPFPA
jgi:hypothetical protein